MRKCRVELDKVRGRCGSESRRAWSSKHDTKGVYSSADPHSMSGKVAGLSGLAFLDDTSIDHLDLEQRALGARLLEDAVGRQDLLGNMAAARAQLEEAASATAARDTLADE